MSVTLVNQHMHVVHLIWQFTVTLYCLTEVILLTTRYIDIMATIQHNYLRLFCSGWTVCWPFVGPKDYNRE